MIFVDYVSNGHCTFYFRYHETVSIDDPTFDYFKILYECLSHFGQLTLPMMLAIDFHNPSDEVVDVLHFSSNKSDSVGGTPPHHQPAGCDQRMAELVVPGSAVHGSRAVDKCNNSHSIKPHLTNNQSQLIIPSSGSATIDTMLEKAISDRTITPCQASRIISKRAQASEAAAIRNNQPKGSDQCLAAGPASTPASNGTYTVIPTDSVHSNAALSTERLNLNEAIDDGRLTVDQARGIMVQRALTQTLLTLNPQPASSPARRAQAH